MSFGMWCVAIFCSPLYFIIRKRWGAFFVNSMFYGMAVVMLISVVGMIFAPFFWMFATGHALWDLRTVMVNKHMQCQAELIAKKMEEDKK